MRRYLPVSRDGPHARGAGGAGGAGRLGELPEVRPERFDSAGNQRRLEPSFHAHREEFAVSGFNVVVADLDISAATAMAGSLGNQAHKAEAVQMDVGQPESVAAGFSRIAEKHGRCDVLVNCAGIAKGVPFP